MMQFDVDVFVWADVIILEECFLRVQILINDVPEEMILLK